MILRERIVITDENPSKHKLVGGFNPFEKYESKWESSPNRGEHKKYLKPPPSKAKKKQRALQKKNSTKSVWAMSRVMTTRDVPTRMSRWKLGSKV